MPDDAGPSSSSAKPPRGGGNGGGGGKAKPKKVVFASSLVLESDPAAVAAVAASDGAAAADEENIILQLKIGSGDGDDLEGAVDPPAAYDQGSIDRFVSRPSELSEAHATIAPATVPRAQNNGDAGGSDGAGLRVVDLLKDFEEKTKHCEWPTSTSVCCYWCCHAFDGVPLGLPMKLVDDSVFHVFGCFCSLACAAAHNMASNDSMDEIWERQNLLNLLGKKLGNDGCVRPAPNRLTLKMFGGYLDIDAFRAHAEGKHPKAVVVNFPPMVAVTQQLEELFENDITCDFKYIPLDHDRIDRYKERLQLKRAKPLVNPKNTLDFSMNLTIQSGTG